MRCQLYDNPLFKLTRTLVTLASTSFHWYFIQFYALTIYVNVQDSNHSYLWLFCPIFSICWVLPFYNWFYSSRIPRSYVLVMTRKPSLSCMQSSIWKTWFRRKVVALAGAHVRLVWVISQHMHSRDLYVNFY